MFEGLSELRMITIITHLKKIIVVQNKHKKVK